MCLPLDGNICSFFQWRHRQTDREKEKESRSRGKSGGWRQETGRIGWSFSCGRQCVRPGCHLTEQTLSLFWTDMGFVKRRLGKTQLSLLHWVYSQSTGCNLMKNNFTLFASLPLQPISMRFKALGQKSKAACLNSSYSAAKIKHYQEIQRHAHTNTHARTKQSRSEKGTPIPSKHSHRLSVHR